MTEEFNLTSKDVTVPEWNLSEKIDRVKCSDTENYIWEGDVKEFVRRLKVEIRNIVVVNDFENQDTLSKIIDKLAGDELSK